MRDGGNGGNGDAAVDYEGDDALSSNDTWNSWDFTPAKFILQIPLGCGVSWFLVVVNAESLSRLCQREVFDEAVMMAPGTGGQYGRAPPVPLVVYHTNASSLIGTLPGAKVNR